MFDDLDAANNKIKVLEKQLSFMTEVFRETAVAIRNSRLNTPDEPHELWMHGFTRGREVASKVVEARVEKAVLYLPKIANEKGGKS